MKQIKKPLGVAILAGGLATRLHPITESIPKALVLVDGKPFVEHQIQLLSSQGITELVLCVGYLGEMIENHLGNGSQFGVTIRYSYDGDKLLGTGGAIRNALNMLGEDFFVLYGDSYLPVDYCKIQTAYQKRAKNEVALMTIFHNKGLWDNSNVWYEKQKVKEYNKSHKSIKMEHIDYGLQIFNKNAFDGYSSDTKFDLAELMSSLVEAGKVKGYEVNERFYEIGSHSGLFELNKIIKQQV